MEEHDQNKQAPSSPEATLISKENEPLLTQDGDKELEKIMSEIEGLQNEMNSISPPKVDIFEINHSNIEDKVAGIPEELAGSVLDEMTIDLGDDKHHPKTIQQKISSKIENKLSMKLQGELTLEIDYEAHSGSTVIALHPHLLEIKLSDGTEFKIPIRSSK